MQKFEYKIFNMSEANFHNEKFPKDQKTWLDLLNRHGLEGWQMKTQMTKNSFLLMREIRSSVVSNQLSEKPITENQEPKTDFTSP